MYKKVSTNLNFVDREKETEKFWDDNHPMISVYLFYCASTMEHFLFSV